MPRPSLRLSRFLGMLPLCLFASLSAAPPTPLGVPATRTNPGHLNIPCASMCSPLIQPQNPKEWVPEIQRSAMRSMAF